MPGLDEVNLYYDNLQEPEEHVTLESLAYEDISHDSQEFLKVVLAFKG
mgnify:FL=1